MLGIVLLSVLGFGVAYAIYDDQKDDDSGTPGVTETGDDSDDTLTGSSGPDLLSGLGGNDVLTGDAGNDLLSGGMGTDDLFGEAGADRLFGGGGDDAMSGGDQNDVLRAGAGRDALVGEDGADQLFGDQGSDWLDGGSGDDALHGGTQADVLVGGAGEDYLSGGNNDDLLAGGELGTLQIDASSVVDLRDDMQHGFANLIQSGLSDGASVDLLNTEDDAADTLLGGFGDDILVVGNGDTATGGGGDDLFIMLEGNEVDPAHVEDYDGAEDAIVMLYEEGTPEPAIDFEDNGDGTMTLTSNGVAVAVFAATGLTAQDVTLVEQPSS